MKLQEEQYRIIHFATHGDLNTEHPELSAIVLSLFDSQGRDLKEDGFLRLHDIYNMKLPADLIVLSACKTGLGQLLKGEGLIGLTRGFMHAGSPRVVASLWRVEDLGTAELMKRFYQHMARGNMAPPSALRQAQIELLRSKRWNSPYFWAGFVLQGEWNAIR
jgi:CHAT domain-containing protein